MKKILLLPLFVLLISCENELIEEPKSLVVEAFYNTAAEVESATNLIYTPLRSSSGLAVYEATLESQTDYAYGRGSWAPLSAFQGLDGANITRVSGLWGIFYTSIRNANLVIYNAPKGKSISEANIKKYVSEAKFLRAYSYFQLVRNWSGVPLRTEENMTEINLKRSTEEEVYNLILADLTEAEANLPETPAVAGRPTTWAAKTLMADVYLQLGKYTEARTKAGEVMSSNKYSLVPVTTKADFQTKVWGPETVSTSEEIFYLKYSRQVGQGNYMLWITNHPNTQLFNFGGAYAVYSDASNAFYKAWDAGDIRKSLWDVVNFGLGTTTLVSSKFTDKLAVGQNGSGNDDPVYGYSDVLLIYAEAAAREANAPTASALEALNQVHRRAYGKTATTASTVDYRLADYTLGQFIDLVLTEKAYEFQFGGKRWLELKRTGKAVAAIQAGKGLAIAEKHYLWPIPVSELNYNLALDPVKDQNPGY